MNQFDRNIKLIGETAQNQLSAKNILIVGIGGVGGYAFEMLVRAGIGNFTIVDGDAVDITNLNRQIIALHSSLGQPKVEAAYNRAKDINPAANIKKLNMRFNENTSEIILQAFDYVIDAIDSVKDKVLLIIRSKQKNIPIISALGAGNRINCDFAVGDIYDTRYDGLAKAVRKKLKENNIGSLKVVSSHTPPLKVEGVPASISYSPAIMGCMIANEVIKDILCL